MMPARIDQEADAARPAGAERSPALGLRAGVRAARRAGRRGLPAMAAVVLGVSGAIPLAAPVAAAPVSAVATPTVAAPAPCDRAERYAAESDAQVFRLNKLKAKSGVATTTNVVVAEAKSAHVAGGTINAASVTRMFGTVDAKTLSASLLQSAPPTHADPARRVVPARAVGAIKLGNGTLTSHAQWDPGMACGVASGDVTQAEAELHGIGIDGRLVRVPKKVRGLSTTALAPGARSSAAAGLMIGGLDLLDGSIHIRVVRPPMLIAETSTKDGGRVRYTPAVLEVSSDGMTSRRLDTTGDVMEVTLADDSAASGTAEEPDTERTIAPLPLPISPKLPTVGESPESARIIGPGMRLLISLGRVRSASSGRAIAAKATAINIAITQGKSDGRTKQGYGGVLLDLDIGVLAAAAVVPAPAPPAVGPNAHGGAAGPDAPAGAAAKAAVFAGDDSGLPITGPAAGAIAVCGLALLIGGGAALAATVRRRRFRS
jgi:hypothetical protein